MTVWLLTFGSVAGLVVVGEPLEVLVLDPGHPVLVLVVVALLDPLHVALALLLFLRQRVEGLLLLVLAHGVPALARGAGCVLDLVGHCVVLCCKVREDEIDRSIDGLVCWDLIDLSGVEISICRGCESRR